jgi:hypothetical protein
VSDRPDYPRRPPYFALSFQRLLAKRCEAQTIGTDGYALLSVIVNIEDSKRYDGPVTFYNSALMAALGFRKWERLDAVRRRLVEHGWLHYQAPPPGARSLPGLYWVTVPAGVTLTNETTLNEPDHPRDYIRQTDTVIRKAYPQNGYGEGDGDGYGRGYGRGEPSIPYTQSPKPTSCDEAAKRPSSPPPAVAPQNVKFPIFPCCGGKKSGDLVWELEPEFLAVLAEAYPGVCIEAEAKKAHAWILANFSKRKTAGGMRRFLQRWMENAQNNGGSRNRGNGFSVHGQSIEPPSMYAELTPRRRAVEPSPNGSHA